MVEIFYIVVANVGFWFNFIIPIATSLYLLATHGEYILKEFGIQVLATLTYVTIAFMLLFSTTTDLRDTEYWNGQVTKFEYYEEWTERVDYTESYSCGTTKSPKTCTRQKTRYDYHSPYWQLTTSNKETVSLSRSEYRQARAKFGDKEVNVSRMNQSSFGDGDKYVSYPNIIIPTAVPHGYTNFVTAAKNTVIKQEVSPADIAYGIKEKTLKSYPAPYENGMGVPNLVRVIDTTNSFGTIEWLKDLNNMANKYGKTKQVNPIIYVTNSDRTFKALLDAHWKKAKKNDAVLILGIQDSGEISWSDTIAWTNNTDFIVDMGHGFEGLNVKTDREKILARFENLIQTQYKRKPMEEFAYLKENITLEWYWQLLILVGNIVMSFFITRYFLGNYNGSSRFRNRFGRR